MSFNPYNFAWPPGYGPPGGFGIQPVGAARPPPPAPPPGFSPDMLFSGSRFPAMYSYGMPYHTQGGEQSSPFGAANWNFPYHHLPVANSSSTQLSPSNINSFLPVPVTSNSSSQVGIPNDQPLPSTARSVSVPGVSGSTICNGNVDNDIVSKVSTILSNPNVLQKALSTQIQTETTGKFTTENIAPGKQLSSSTEVCDNGSNENSNEHSANTIEKIVAATMLKLAGHNPSTLQDVPTPPNENNLASVRYAF